MRVKYLLVVLLLVLLLPVGAQSIPVEEAIYTSEYYLSIYPNYPPLVGEKITLRLRTFKPAQKVTIYSDREKEIPMTYREGYWWGKFQIPSDYKEGGHFFTVWIRYPFPSLSEAPDFYTALLIRIGLIKKRPSVFWSKTVVWYRMLKPSTTAKTEIKMVPFPEVPSETSYEVEEEIPIVTGEAVAISVPSVEVVPFVIKGSKTLSFTSKSIEGSKEGFAPGVSREEALRLNISGKSDDTEIEANLISTSTAGTTQVTQREDKVSVLVRKGSTEAYLGDFTADLTETEFTKLNKVLSGVRVKGEYERWGFNALYSSPKGEARLERMYGDGTQGPYRLSASKKVVIDSEKVYVDSVLQTRGDDYVIDYDAKTITFKKRIILNTSVIEVRYDESETTYQHSTYGVRLTAKPLSNLKVGATYLNDSDSLPGVSEIGTAETPPQSHYVFGFDSSYVSESLSANSEIAYSEKILDISSGTGTKEVGKAIKLDLGSQLGPLGITAYGKRVGAKFQPIAESSPKQDVTAYGGGLSLRPGALFGAQGSYNYEKYTQSGTIYENIYELAKASLTPEKIPSLEYVFSQNEESNDPVTGNPIKRVITRNSAETTYRLGFLSTSLKSTNEKWLNRYPSEEVTDYKRINFGLATLGLEKITFTSNVELEDRVEPTGDTPHRKTYNLNLSLSPVKQYFASLSLEYLDDSAQGIKNVTDLSYRVEPNEVFRTDGKYTITSVNENYATVEAVSKQTGSFSLDFRPMTYLRLHYLFKPNFTKILRTGTLSFNNEQQQAEINLIPAREVALGMLYKVGHSFHIFNQDYPNYTIKDNTSDTDSTLYTLKMAPFQIFSTEFNYLLENGTTTKIVTTEPLAYITGKSFGKKFDALIRTSLSERFSVDSRYTYQRNTEGTGELPSNLVDSVSHTASLKGIWNLSDFLSLSLSGAYTKTINNLSPIPLTYTYSPGFGIVYRQGDKLRIDFDYTYSKSYSGSETALSDYSLRVKYSLSDYVNMTLRAERQVSFSPDYKLTDIAGNIEINL